MNIQPEQLWAQYQAGVKLWPFFAQIEQEMGLPPCLLWAVASRETGMDRTYAEGKVHDDGHGWGLFGADDRWNDLDLPAFASDPRSQARLAGSTLATNRRRLGNWLDAINAYGPEWARTYDLAAYGPDVLARAQYLANRARGGPAVARIYTRAEWGARPANSITPAPGMTRGIGVHHLGEGWGPTDDLDVSMAKMREIQDFHMGPQRGWNDFAYNFAVDFHGNGFVGRGYRVRNAANGGGIFAGLDANAGWLSILYLAGSSGPDLTPEAQDTIWQIAEGDNLAGGDWLGHDDFLSTECPGPDRRRWLDNGHPRGHTAPPPPSPAPDQEESDMYVHDGPLEVGGGIYQSDGDRAWGVPNGEWLDDYFFSGLVKHGGRLHVETFWQLRDRDGNPRVRTATATGNTVGLSAIEAEGLVEVNGDLCRSIAEYAASSGRIEVGNPGCE